jgi:hypothetical protein
MDEKFSLAAKEVESAINLCTILMKTKTYGKLGGDGLLALLFKGRSLGLDPIDSVTGSLYMVNGKIEMAAQTMNYLIRRAGHSFMKGEASDDTICILHGKRADNEDTMTCSFSIDDAKRAGIFKGPWLTYPADMLFARALSRLGRQLFPDVIRGCYVEGEIASTPAIEKFCQAVEAVEVDARVTENQAEELSENLKKCAPEFVSKIWEGIKRSPLQIDSLSDLPISMHARILTAVNRHIASIKQDEVESNPPM